MVDEKPKRGRPRKAPVDKNAQTEANKRWQADNKERTKYLNKRSTARSFVRQLATLEDLDELTALIDERRQQFS
jgi:hypothetical protein